MHWSLGLTFILGGLMVFMAMGMPVAFAFTGIGVVGAFVFWGGFTGLQILADSMFNSLAQFAFIPLPLFLLMGAIVFETGIMERVIKTCNILLGRMPGRLSLVAIWTGTLLAALTASSLASCAVLAKNLAPQMYANKYKEEMVMGPIAAAGQLAPMIPPSAIAIFLAGVANLSVGRLLVAIIVPGLVMSACYSAYIVIRCWMRPDLAPAYDTPPMSTKEKLKAVAVNLVPLSVILFGVTGVIFVGIATPEESAGFGVVSCYILAACYRSLTWEAIKKSAMNALEISLLSLMILAMALGFAKMIAFTGVITVFVQAVADIPFPPILVIIGSQIVLLILGMPLGAPSMILTTVPIYMPIVQALGYDEIWFAVMMMINVSAAEMSPPIGVNAFVLQTFAQPGTTTFDVFRAGYPFLWVTCAVILIIMFFPQTVLWLPSIMLSAR